MHPAGELPEIALDLNTILNGVSIEGLCSTTDIWNGPPVKKRTLGINFIEEDWSEDTPVDRQKWLASEDGQINPRSFVLSGGDIGGHYKGASR